MKQNIRRCISAIICSILLILPLLAQTVFADAIAGEGYYYSPDFDVQVTGSEGRINFRTGPGTSYPIMNVINNGMILHISDLSYNPEDGFFWGWTSYGGNMGWVSIRQTTVLTGYGYQQPDFYVIVSAEGGSLNYRSGPGLTYPASLEIPNGQVLHISDISYNPTDGFLWGYTFYGINSGWVSLRQTLILREYDSFYNNNIIYEPADQPIYLDVTDGYMIGTYRQSIGTTLYATGNELNVRYAPTHDSMLVVTVAHDLPMTYYGENGYGLGSDGVLHVWYKVYLPTGASGYVRSDLVRSYY